MSRAICLTMRRAMSGLMAISARFYTAANSHLLSKRAFAEFYTASY